MDPNSEDRISDCSSIPNNFWADCGTNLISPFSGSCPGLPPAGSPPILTGSLSGLEASEIGLFGGTPDVEAVDEDFKYWINYFIKIVNLFCRKI